MKCEYCSQFKPKTVEDKFSIDKQVKGCNGTCTIPASSNKFHMANGSNIQFPKHKGVLSIKYIIRGRAHYQLDNRSFEIHENEFLLLDQPSNYYSNLGMGNPSQNLCIYFQDNYATELLSSLVIEQDHLLDDPNKSTDLPIHFIEKVYRNSYFSTYLDKIAKGLIEEVITEENAHEYFYGLLTSLLMFHRTISKEIVGLPYIKKSTQIELYKRLHGARDEILSNYKNPLDLDYLSQISCMSKYHLLREFKKLFKVTPHQLIMSLRLKEAQQRLLQTEEPINQIALDIGFSSKHYFSLFFKRQVGIEPSQFRKIESLAMPT